MHDIMTILHIWYHMKVDESIFFMNNKNSLHHIQNPYNS